jgi:hypothetical protein
LFTEGQFGDTEDGALESARLIKQETEATGVDEPCTPLKLQKLESAISNNSAAKQGRKVKLGDDSQLISTTKVEVKDSTTASRVSMSLDFHGQRKLNLVDAPATTKGSKRIIVADSSDED